MVENCGVTHHASRHEEAAVAMTDGYARVSGKLAVCTVHQGPGVTNTLTALTEAVKSRTPLLLLAGNTATTALYQNLDVDQDAVASSVGAGVERIRRAETAVEDVARAVYRAEIERRPIVVSLPIDIQEQTCDLERIGEDDPEDEAFFRDLCKDEGERETVLEILKAECEVLPGRPEDYLP